MPRKRTLAASLALVAVLGGLVFTSVNATFPGRQDGRIAFGVRAADGSANIFSVLPDGKALRQLTTGPENHLCAAYRALPVIVGCGISTGVQLSAYLRANGAIGRAGAVPFTCPPA